MLQEIWKQDFENPNIARYFYLKWRILQKVEQRIRLISMADF